MTDVATESAPAATPSAPVARRRPLRLVASLAALVAIGVGAGLIVPQWLATRRIRRALAEERYDDALEGYVALARGRGRDDPPLLREVVGAVVEAALREGHPALETVDAPLLRELAALERPGGPLLDAFEEALFVWPGPGPPLPRDLDLVTGLARHRTEWREALRERLTDERSAIDVSFHLVELGDAAALRWARAVVQAPGGSDDGATFGRERAALEAIAELGDEAADLERILALSPALPAVRRRPLTDAAIGLLGARSAAARPAAARHLRARLTIARRSGDRVTLAAALLRLGDETGRPLLERVALDDVDGLTPWNAQRLEAAIALDRVGDPAAREVVATFAALDPLEDGQFFHRELFRWLALERDPPRLDVIAARAGRVLEGELVPTREPWAFEHLAATGRLDDLRLLWRPLANEDLDEADLAGRVLETRMAALVTALRILDRHGF